MKQLVYGIIILLVLAVVKAILVKVQFEQAFFVGIIINSIQFLLITGYVLFLLNRIILRRLFPNRKITLINCIVIGVQLALLEGLAGYWLHHSQRIPSGLLPAYSYYYDNYGRTLLQYDRNAIIYDPKLFYAFKPGANFSFDNAEFNTHITVNSRGLRDDESSLHQPSIICVGDSYTMGWGVQQQESFPQLLEKYSGKKVLNAGVPSYGTPREIISLSNLDRSALQFLVVQYCTNDNDENYTYLEHHDSLPISPLQQLDKIKKAHEYTHLYFPGKHFSMIAQIFLKQLVNKVIPVFKLVKEPDWPEKEKVVRNLLDIVAKAPVDFDKVKVILVQLDTPKNMTDQFSSLADSLLRTPYYASIFKNNCRVIDVTKDLNNSDYYLLDTHLKPAGHKKLATALLPLLETF